MSPPDNQIVQSYIFDSNKGFNSFLRTMSNPSNVVENPWSILVSGLSSKIKTVRYKGFSLTQKNVAKNKDITVYDYRLTLPEGHVLNVSRAAPWHDGYFMVCPLFTNQHVEKSLQEVEAAMPQPKGDIYSHCQSFLQKFVATKKSFSAQMEEERIKAKKERQRQKRYPSYKKKTWQENYFKERYVSVDCVPLLSPDTPRMPKERCETRRPHPVSIHAKYAAGAYCLGEFNALQLAELVHGKTRRNLQGYYLNELEEDGCIERINKRGRYYRFKAVPKDMTEAVYTTAVKDFNLPDPVKNKYLADVHTARYEQNKTLLSQEAQNGPGISRTLTL